MKRYLLDTGIAADYVNRGHGVYPRVREAVAAGARLGLCAPVLGELWDGIFFSSTRGFNEALLKRHLGHFAIWPFDQVAAFQYGQLAAQMRRAGRIMQQIDLQVAAIALTLADCTVVSKDSDLQNIPGLSVENWAV